MNLSSDNGDGISDNYDDNSFFQDGAGQDLLSDKRGSIDAGKKTIGKSEKAKNLNIGSDDYNADGFDDNYDDNNNSLMGKSKKNNSISRPGDLKVPPKNNDFSQSGQPEGLKESGF